METIRALLPLAGLLIFGSLSTSAQPSPPQGWSHQSEIIIDNTGPPLEDYQVRIDLNMSSIDFSRARTDGTDVRLTTDDNQTVPFWIERWDPTTRTARIWARVPLLPRGVTTLLLYYGNPAAPSASNGSETFLFFDDFTTLGYFSLGPAQTVLRRKRGTFEQTAPHTLSVVENEKSGYSYWGYYGPSYWKTAEGSASEHGWVGLVRSNDLVHWERYERNPLLAGTRERWPSVLLVGGTFYMAYTENYGTNTSRIMLRTSMDGINFGPPEELVSESGVANQNPALFRKHDEEFYLYWLKVKINSFVPLAGEWTIQARKASTVRGLARATTNIVLGMQKITIASPQVMYHPPKYYLAVEARSPGGNSEGNVWYTLVYESSDPISGFTKLPGNPVLGDGSGCFSQHIFDNKLHAYYCKETPPDIARGEKEGSTWTVDYRAADLTAGPAPVPYLDSAKWPGLAGSSQSWQMVPSAPRKDGSQGAVLQGTMTAAPYQTLESSFSGSDYVLEASGRQIDGRVWGLGVRTSKSSLYSVFIYDDPYPKENLYIVRWGGDSVPVEVDKRSVGKIESGVWIDLTVKVHARSEFEVYVNGQHELSAKDQDEPILSGGVALYGEPGTTAQFRHVFVRKYAATEPSVAILPSR